MYTATLIRKHIYRLGNDKPFSIRDFLNYGSRNAVDQVFYRLVKRGQIIRVARGLFIKGTAPMPSILDVALAKAKAFGKRLAMHGLQACQHLQLIPGSLLRDETLYACSGPSSSFRFGAIRVRLINVGPRKMALKNDLAGLTIKALWYLGKAESSTQLISDLLISFSKKDRQLLRRQFPMMPAWLSRYFRPPDIRRRQRFGLQAYLYRN